MNKISFIFLVLLALWSCSDDDEVTASNDSEENTLLTFEQAKARYETLRTTNAGLTRTAGFPTTGTRVYKGIHGGRFFDCNSTSETRVEYYAQVEFNLDFETGEFTGKLTNFRTDLEGFETPEGELNVSGVIRDTQEMGGDEYGLRFRVQDGELTQGERTAIFDGRTESKGRFSGNTGQFANIRITSTFSWTAGPDTGTVSGTIGFMLSEREE